jgi:hypothetical protein
VEPVFQKTLSQGGLNNKFTIALSMALLSFSTGSTLYALELVLKDDSK